MKAKVILGLVLLIILVGVVSMIVLDEGNAMLDYFNRPEPQFRWWNYDEMSISGGTVFTFHMISQTWQEINWVHQVQIFYPNEVQYPHFATLINVGGSPSGEDNETFMRIAEQKGSPFVVLYGIPNQPLFDGLREDALIVYTWIQFFETNDPTWPLHFPMAKAVLKCMDAVQEFLPSVDKPKPEKFLITGASKRGWTSWLVGASQDERVAGIAPMVIDTLNLPAQVPHHLEFYRGVPSEEIGDYTVSGMLEMLNTPFGRKLVDLTDPYSYRDLYTMPKLIINGTNDRYWALDALNLYWDSLPAPKSVLYVPNSGHGLEDRERVYATMIAFARKLAQDQYLPAIDWQFKESDEAVELNVSSETAIRAYLWIAYTTVHDFRDASWISFSMKETPEGWNAEIKRPLSGWAAFFAELVFESNGMEYRLSTTLRIVEQD